jgi:restriction system protein
MTIPGFQSIMLPLLKIASDEAEHNHAEVRDSLAVQFRISDSEKKEMLPSGKQARFDNRVAWAIVYLRRSRLIKNSSRGIFHITVQGMDLLKTNPDKIDIKLLKQLNPEIKKWSKNSDQSIDNEKDTIITTETPMSLRTGVIRGG